MTGIDLNTMRASKISEFSGIFEVNHVYRQARFRPDDGTHTNEGFSPLRTDLQWKPQDQILQLPGSIPLHGHWHRGYANGKAFPEDISAGANRRFLSR
jgi:hypothetical protein